MSMSLYQLTGNFLVLQEMMMDSDIDPETLKDTLEAMEGNIEDKLNNYGKIITNLKGLASNIKEEKKRLDEKEKTINNQIERMKKNIKESMIAMDKKDIQTELFSFTVKSGVTSVVIDDVDKVPKDFRIPQPDKINKDGIKQLLKSSDKDFNNYAHLKLGEPSLLMR